MAKRARLKEIGDSSGEESEEYLQLLSELKDMVCNAKEKTVCCENSISVTRECSSEGGNSYI